jgi:hypothetical protein
MLLASSTSRIQHGVAGSFAWRSSFATAIAYPKSGATLSASAKPGCAMAQEPGRRVDTGRNHQKL